MSTILKIKEYNIKDSTIVGYTVFYKHEGKLKSKIIPVELKSKFVKKFSEKLRDLTITENEINKFLDSYKK
jgi:hypothetical protein